MDSNKAIVQLLGVCFSAVLPQLLTSEPFGLTDYINMGVLAAGAATVWIAANQPGDGVWAYTKAIMSAISAGGVVAISAFGDGTVSRVEGVQIAVAVLTAAGVLYISNGPDGRHRRDPGLA